MNRSHSFAWILVSLLLLALAAPLQAGIIPSGDVDPVNYSWWHNGGNISTDAYIGYSSTGSVTVHLGSDLSSRYSGIGYNAGATGVVTVDGSGSTWTSSSYFGTFVIGNKGQGTLNITDGGSVSSNDHSYIGYEDGSIGEVTVDGSSSAWTNSYSLYVGRSGQGTLNITNGGSVSDSWGGFIGHWSDSTGVVTVDGGGSTWNSGGLYVGYWGQGTLNITNGGTVISNYDSYIGWDSTGVVTVAGSGSTWTNSDTLFVGNCGQGTLNITDGGAVSNNYGYIGYNVGSSGEVTVDGAGSTWTNSGSLYVGGFGGAAGGTGLLDVRNGGEVNANAITVWTTGKIVLGVSGNDMLIANSNFTNDGIVRLTAGAGLAAGTYTPISVGGWLGTGGYEAFGGRWDVVAHTFTVVALQIGDSGEEITVELSDAPRLDIIDIATGYQVGASFAEGTGTINFTATAMTDLAELAIVASGEPLSGWDFDTNLPPGEEVLLSFNVGDGYNTEDLEIWYYDNAGDWTAYDVTDLTYAGGWVSFTVDGFSGYAVTNVPEPASAMLLLSGGVLAMLKRKSHRTVWW